jgi:hypothetical protein
MWGLANFPVELGDVIIYCINMNVSLTLLIKVSGVSLRNLIAQKVISATKSSL